MAISYTYKDVSVIRKQVTAIHTEFEDEAYYSPRTEKGWWIDGDTYITNLDQVEVLREVLEAIAAQVQFGNVRS